MSPQLAFHENVGQPCESLFFLPSESENRIEKSRFFLVSMTLKKACRFSIFEKITDVSKIINLGTNWSIFSKALMMHYRCAKFHVSSIYLYLEI